MRREEEKRRKSLSVLAPTRHWSPAPHVDRNDPMRMTHGLGHAISATVRLPPILSPNLPVPLYQYKGTKEQSVNVLQHKHYLIGTVISLSLCEW